MHDVETQLARYGERLQELHGPQSSVEDRVDPLRSNKSRRPSSRRLALAGALAVLVAIVGGALSLRWVNGDNETGTEIASSASTTSSVEGSDDPLDRPEPQDGDDEDAGVPIDAADVVGRVLPDPLAWPVAKFEFFGSDGAAPQAIDEIAVFVADDRFVALSTGYEDPEAGPLDEAEVMTQFNRQTIGWRTPDGESVTLLTIDTEPAELALIAATLERDSRGWTLPGYERTVLDSGGDLVTGRRYQLQLVGMVDGEPDLSLAVSQDAHPAAPGDLYRVLFEAGDLGPVVVHRIGDAAAFVVGVEGAGQTAFADIDGALITWNATSPDVDLGELLESATTVDTKTWLEQLEGADGIFADALDQASESVEPIPGPVDGLVRFLPGAGWELQTVYDLGLLSDEERAAFEAALQARLAELDAETALNGGTIIETTSAQLFARPETDPREAEIRVAVYTGGAGFNQGINYYSEPEPIVVGQFDGLLSEDPWSKRVTAVSDTAGFEVTSPSLSRDELLDFVATLEARDGSWVNGFESSSDDFELIFEGTERLKGGWSAELTNGRSTAVVAVAPGGSPGYVADDAFWYRAEPIEPMPTVESIDEFLVIDNGGWVDVSWYSPEHDAVITISAMEGATVDDAVELARSLRPVTEQDWATAAGPVVVREFDERVPVRG